MTKRALVTGCTGQDGAYLCKFLLEKGYDVYGAYRRVSTPNFWRLNYLGVFDKIKLIPFDLVDITSINETIKISDPDEIYNLAAQSFVGTSFEQPVGTGMTDGIAVVAMLEGIRQINPSIKLYQASTSEMYGAQGLLNEKDASKPLNESSTFSPMSPYAAAKLYGYWQTKIYRKGYDLFACNGILFNHESPLRGLEFVTRKVSNAVAKIHVGLEKEVVLGNMSPGRDWGYAPEYVEGMWSMLQQKKPDDYVLATGESHTVQTFVNEAFASVGLNWEDHVKLDKKFTRPVEVNFLRGDNSKAAKALGWKPKTSFKQIVKIMVNADVERWERLLKGETFPWDAPNYSSEAKIITRGLKGA